MDCENDVSFLLLSLVVFPRETSKHERSTWGSGHITQTFIRTNKRPQDQKCVNCKVSGKRKRDETNNIFEMKWYQQKPTILKLDRCRTKTLTTPNMRCFIPTLNFTDDHIWRYWYRTKVRTTLTTRSFGIARLFFSKILKSDIAPNMVVGDMKRGYETSHVWSGESFCPTPVQF